MKYLFLAEKPSTMNAIKAAYNNSNKPIGDIDFMALSGHVCKMSEPKAYEKWDVTWKERDLPMIPSQFKVEATRGEILEKIRAKISSGEYGAIIVGTDSDVEGNGIYDLVETYLGLQKMQTFRFFESDLTPTGIMKSIQNLQDYHTNPRDVGMTQAYRIRSRFDWLIGFNMSVAYTVKSGFLMKVGRVKAPTLKLVYDNCAAIDNFKSKTAYQPSIEAAGITARLVDESNKTLSYPEKSAAEAILKELSGTATVKDVKKEIKKTAPDQLYKLTDIQYEAGIKYGYTPEQTLDIIQSLYETHKLISYPRTDGRYVSSEKAKDFERLLQAVGAMDGLSDLVRNISPAAIEAVRKNKRYVNDAEVQKNSHDALLPTGETAALDRLKPMERNICDMIYRRFLAIFLPPLEEEKTHILLEDNGHLFARSGSRVLSPGFTVLFKRPQEASLPSVTAGANLKEDKQFLHEVVSKPPARFTQASLLKEMEDISKYVKEKDLKNALKQAKGIGQPSSRAAIISELVKTGYVRDKKGLYITDAGKAYIENLGDSSIVSPKLSAEWEMHMSDIREGTASYDEVYQQILQYLKEALQEVEQMQMKHVPSADRRQIGNCPVCGKPVVELPKGYGCSGYPECKFSVFKIIAGRTLKEREVVNLIKNKSTGELSGFKSREGKAFSAELIVKDGQVTWAPLEKPTDLICPKCGKPLIKTPMLYKCTDCDFILWKTICEYKLSDADVRDLLTNGKTRVINGFKSKKGNKFSARLVMKDFKLEFEFVDNVEDTGLTCPLCAGKIVKTPHVYKCQAQGCGFVIYRTMSQVALRDTDIRDLITKGNTRVIDGFVGKSGKEFSARLSLENGKVNFNFQKMPKR